MTADDVNDWLDRYVEVWRSGESRRVAELFTEDAVYFADPFQPPRRGHQEIARLWEENGDPPDGFEAAYAPLAVLGESAVASGYSRYLDDPRTAVSQEYSNIFVLRFAADGRVSEYREWYMLRAAVAVPAA